MREQQQSTTACRKHNRGAARVDRGLLERRPAALQMTPEYRYGFIGGIVVSQGWAAKGRG
jgi:hypothetical protein